MYLITGGSGFVGGALIKALQDRNRKVIAPVRILKPNAHVNNACLTWVEIGEFDRAVSWTSLLNGVQTVVHCAARAHVIQESVKDVMDAYQEVNVLGTLNLARQAAAAGVKRFVFLSSIGVNGNLSVVPFTESSSPNPHDAYSQSKFQAEQELLTLAEQTGIEVVIIRSPLVYGPGAPGNFAALISWVQRGLPLPLGCVKNQRSLIALDNLVSFISLCAERNISPQAANHVFLVADGEDVSISTLLRKVAQAAGRPIHLVKIPPKLLRLGATFLGKQAMADRLLANLQVDTSKARTLLGWQPIVTMDEQLVKVFEMKNQGMVG